MTARLAALEPLLSLRGPSGARHAPLVAMCALVAALAVIAGTAEIWLVIALVAFLVLTGTLSARAHHQAAHRRQSDERLEAALRSTIHELRESRARVANVADTERRRIERDLHDGCQQRLIALRVKLALAEELMNDENEPVGYLIHEIAADAEKALEDLHALVHGIYPSALTDRGLGDAVVAMARAAPVHAHVLVDAPTRYTPEVEAAVYFTCAEALQNAAKHAGPGATARIALRQEGGGLAFEVRDDGCGFDANAPGGSGLANMDDRVGAVGGRLRVASAPGRGTSVQGWVPEVPLVR